MNAAIKGVEEFFRRRYSREAIYLPSGRLALYLALREYLRRGDRILMSPVNDDVVFFTVLAAGLVPVLGPVDPSTGNLDPAAIDEAAWSGLKAVMTTNLYGVPDRMELLEDRCRFHQLLLVEDACQALDSVSGSRRIGEFGPVAAFSLTKHVPGVGAVLVFSEAGRREVFLRRAAEEIRLRSFPRAMGALVRSFLKDLADATGTREALSGLRRRVAPLPEEREGHRIPYRLEQVVRASREGAGLDRFDPWVRIDDHSYRTAPLMREVRETLRLLESFEENRRRRIEGTRKLLELGLTPSGFPRGVDQALFRVPLMVRDREAVRSRLVRRGLRLDYIYDPPLDLYAPPDLADRISSPPEAIIWSRDVLPVDPLQADVFLELLKVTPPPVQAGPGPIQ